MGQSVDLDSLTELSPDALEEHFKTLFGLPASPYMHRDVLIRSVAHRLQEEAEGGPRRDLHRRLAKLAKTIEKPEGKRPRALRSGTRLLREWQGTTHSVSVTDGGFVYQGRTYKSLSVIARTITGTRWSGPAFFGLRGPP